jgi:hypothetical protein
MRALLRCAVPALAALILVHAERAWAPYHVVVVDQVFFGTEDCPNAQYVQMRLLTSGMRFVANQEVTTQNADGSAGPDFGVFANAVPEGMAGDTFIMGTADAAGLFGISMDEEATGSLALPDGRVCFGAFPPPAGPPVDCVAYGNFTGDNAGGGDPAVAAQLGMALTREGDDQNGDDATDFMLAAPAPRNNAGDVGALGECPGAGPTATATGLTDATPTSTPGNAAPTETATAVPTGPVVACVGDCNGTGQVQISELVTCVNVALGNTPPGNCPACDANSGGKVEINELIVAVNNALSGCPA